MKILKIIFLLFLINFLHANEHAHKNIIKLEKEEDFKLINLHQQGNLSNNEQSFDSSTLLKKTPLKSNDTKEDFALLVVLGNDLSFKINDFKVLKREFAKDIFDALFKKIYAKKSLSLLNPAQNIVYETPRLYADFNKGIKREIFGISGLLSDESGFKRPDYVLFLALDHFEIIDKKTFFIYNQKIAHFKIPFKILNIKTKKLINSKILSLDFALSKSDLKNSKKAYQLSVERIADLLFDFLQAQNLLK